MKDCKIILGIGWTRKTCLYSKVLRELLLKNLEVKSMNFLYTNGWGLGEREYHNRLNIQFLRKIDIAYLSKTLRY